ncbi:MAG: M15 family metallopeptidase [Acidobacteria bacterium]|nr:M15 family metallopeptidase [Acidobacteriota bacterium]
MAAAALVSSVLSGQAFADVATIESASEGVGGPTFVESWGCGEPATTNPKATKTGWLSDSELLRGPRADFFGRTVGQIRDVLVPWEIPMSGGTTRLVHVRALPAFQQVTANLAAEQAKGNWYAVRGWHSYGFTPRTIAGRTRISFHTFGNAMDINSTTNPYRADGVLVTDMPTWFVQAWQDAGFCWGGDWQSVKDPMHFSWMGPAFTPGYNQELLSYPPLTAQADFTTRAQTTSTEFGVVGADHRTIADGNGNGVRDIYNVRDGNGGVIVEYSRSDKANEWCAVSRLFAPDVSVAGREVVLGDFYGKGRNDLWFLDDSGATLEVEIVDRAAGYEESVVLQTAIPVGSDDTYLAGDYNRDGRMDLFVIRSVGSVTRVEVWSGATLFLIPLKDTDTGLGDTQGWSFSLDDRDLDRRPDLVAAHKVGNALQLLILTYANGYVGTPENIVIASDLVIADLAFGDYDGDGRGDAWIYGVDGTLEVYLGNTQLDGTNYTSWFLDPGFTCDADALPYNFEGTFRDDDDSIHVASIEYVAAAGITVGCNPPYGDEFCPTSNVTRGAMAAFLVRALNLPATSEDFFTDDNESIFQDDINRIAAAGITLGCNPPTNDNFCPNAPVTRGQMAAFLVRAFALHDPGVGNFFNDDDGSVFEGSIDRLRVAGITSGCNPPANDRFCPGRNIPREEMAAFLHRALTSG